MFKRVDKRRRKKEEEEKLGLDEEVKEILGIQDTDSEESESDSDSDSDSREQGDIHEEIPEEDYDEEDPSITVGQALKDPFYIVSILPDVKACIVCPGKLLKSVKMVQLHRTSNAHMRRFKQFSDGSADANSNDNAWEILKRNSETKPRLQTTAGGSKRAEKKKGSQARRKARREEAKEKAKAKKAKATSESAPAQLSETLESTKPRKKKRKIDMGHQLLPPAKMSTTSVPSALPPATKKSNGKESAKPPLVTNSAATALEDYDDARGPPNTVKIQDVAKSTSNRAKTARSRALSMSKNTSRLSKSAVP